MEFHNLAGMFPLLEGEAFAELVADVREHGVREPIVLLDGRILDGRNRYRASQEAGVACPSREFSGDPVAFVVSLNLKRRHLNESQRAMVAAELAKIKHGEVGRGHEKSECQISTSDAAALLNVSTSSVRNARQVLSQGTPEEVEAIKKGEASVGTIARDIQRKVPEQKRRAKRDTPLAAKGKNPERFERQRVDAEVWKRVKGALDDLTSLPLPSDVAELISAQVKRTDLVNAKLPSALKWIEDFSNAWTSK